MAGAEPSTTIVVPCYNEGSRLAPDRFVAFARRDPATSFLFVDDGSLDGTPGVLAALREVDPARFGVRRLPRNAGKAEAVRVGVLQACAARPAYVGYWDADLAAPLEAIPLLREVLDARPDLLVVLGSRVRLLGRSIERSWTRHYLSRVFATAASLAVGLPVYDTQCGAKLFRATPAVAGLFEEPFLTRWLFDLEILARLRQRSARGLEVDPCRTVYEFPLPAWREVPGSKVRPGDFVSGAVALVAIYRRYRR